MRRLLIFLLLAAALATGCTPRPEGRIVYGLTLAPTGIDPHINASAELGIPLTSVYDTLVYQDPKTGEFVPGLAQKWEVSEDGRVYTFYLRRGVKFHDGTPFNAEAVRFNLDRITSPDLASQKARFMLGPYERTEVVDEYTVRIVLKEPFAPLLDSLSQVYLAMASPTAVQQWGNEYQVHQVGTGPFVFVEYVPGRPSDTAAQSRLCLGTAPSISTGRPNWRRWSSVSSPTPPPAPRRWNPERRT
jgi:ABC-type transport system substrate-binding protein